MWSQACIWILPEYQKWALLECTNTRLGKTDGFIAQRSLFKIFSLTSQRLQSRGDLQKTGTSRAASGPSKFVSHLLCLEVPGFKDTLGLHIPRGTLQLLFTVYCQRAVGGIILHQCTLSGNFGSGLEGKASLTFSFHQRCTGR